MPIVEGKAAPARAGATPLVVLGLLIATFVAGCGSVGPEADGASTLAVADDADPGRDAWVLPDEMGNIYAAQCAVCHGANLEGAAQGPSLRADPLAHGSSVEALTRSIAEGRPAKGMPAWAGVIPPDDIRGLAIYIAEKREADHGDLGQGIGPPPEIPTEPISTRHYSLVIESLHEGIEEPFSLAPLPDGRILFTEKMRGLSILSADGREVTRVTGTPRFYDDAVVRGTTYTGSGWAHEVELHPDHAENGWIYLSFGDRCEGCTAESRASGEPATMLKVVRGRLDGARWVDEQTIWEARREHYQVGAENGLAARLAFDDAGYVYVTIGSIAADYVGVQDLGRPYGKTLRLHDDGRVPSDNPFVDVPGALPEIWTLGHRNAQGLAFDRATGRLWSSEHGPRGGDEANLLLPGRNYGWPVTSLGVDYDGRPLPYAKKLGIEVDPAALTPTKIDWTPSPGVSSIVFYRGDLFPAWRDHMIVATLARGELWRYVVDADGAVEHEILVPRLSRFRDVEVGPDGALLALLEHSTGSRLLRIRPASR